jgi:hypothetical protein
VEVRGTQSKRYLEEKVKLFLEHDWPVVWIAHAERREVEVLHRGLASVTYRLGARVPLLSDLDKHGLREVPVAAFFDDAEASRVIDGWVRARGRAEGRAEGLRAGIRSICEVLAIPLSTERERALAEMDDTALDALLAQIKRERRW